MEIYTGNKPFNFFEENSHVSINILLALLRFIHEECNDLLGRDMNDYSFLVNDTFLVTFSWRGFGYMRALCDILFEQDVDYMKYYM